MGRFISDALFHFVGRSRPTDHEANYEVLTKILRRGCISHAPHLDNWGATSYKIRTSEETQQAAETARAIAER
jgi:hypothetical protein